MIPARTPLALLAAALLLAGSAFVGPAALHAAQETGAHSRLVATIASDTMRDRLFERQLEIGFRGPLEQDPELAEIEMECPGFADALVAGLTPTLRRSHDVDYDWFRDRLTALFESGMSEDEAADAADFFSGETGQRLLLTIATQQSGTNALRDIMADDDMTISPQSMDKDRADTVQRVQEAIGKEEMDAIISELALAGWFPAFEALQPRMSALNLELANLDYTPEEYAEIDRLTAEIAEAHFTRCDAADPVSGQE
ncbi:hypothetical protein Ga0102493_111667 [Erythrobacter litoralis]|uniref:DUF2059 domain-containing protein n=1 Tax=Erythrobacter litoralis TaxID=39960 RepID=A0A074MDL7_9SPHN|nr:hypothetical protein [Erythrobacter litoralis]AOL22691.1 hypothetical protein Ga0102493_111667 [Erythrobacter litoralis]KEO89943.1 hypothetical protein EH32_02850 [Erythrobacter litoralis]